MDPFPFRHQFVELGRAIQDTLPRFVHPTGVHLPEEASDDLVRQVIVEVELVPEFLHDGFGQLEHQTHRSATIALRHGL